MQMHKQRKSALLFIPRKTTCTSTAVSTRYWNLKLIKNNIITCWLYDIGLVVMHRMKGLPALL